MSLSLLSIPLSTVDLKALVKQPATINTSFQIEKSRPKPELPPNFTYENDVRNGNQKNGEFSEGLISVVESTWNGNVYGFADESGKIVIKPQFGWVSDFHEGLAAAKTIGEHGSIGFIDRSGTWIIKPRFEFACQFHDGVAEVAFKRFGALFQAADRRKHRRI